MNTIQVTTPCGVVEGFQEDGVNCFLGIPYATAKRFEYPQPVVSWKGICDAKKYGPAPIQQRAYVQVDASDPAELPGVGDHLWRRFGYGAE